ncbi:serine hydrolase [Acidobacteriota bacterium]
MKRSSLFILLLILSVVFLSFYLKKTISPTEKSKLQTKVDKIFENWDKSDSPGAAIAVVKGKRVVYTQGYGSANLEYDIPISPKTIFHVASVSKQFTAFAITMLADSGNLSLDDDIRLYLPRVPDFGKTITIRHLLHHISGLRDQWELLAMGGWRLDDVITKNHILKMIRRQKDLNFDPGEEYLYCNTGFTLLAEIVERITKQSFPDWTKENIFDPLDMTHTHFHENHEQIVKNRSYSYSPQGKDFRKRVLSYANVGATSLFTTVEDMAKWVMNFDSKIIANDSILEQMHNLGILNSGKEINYAQGLLIGEYKGLKTVGHGGADAGFRSQVVRFPEEDFSVIVLSNLSSINTGNLAMQVADIYLAKKIKVKTPQKKQSEKTSIELNPKILETYEGLYQIRPDYVLTIKKQNEQLTVQGTGGTKYVLYAESERQFFRRNANFEIFFEINNVGDITKITVRDNGKEIEGKKILPVHLNPEQISEYTGEYYSSELDTFYRIVLDEDHLIATHQKHDDFSLSGITPDYYLGTEWFFRTVHFTRDNSNRIDGFMVTGSRVRNLQFIKQ